MYTGRCANCVTWQTDPKVGGARAVAAAAHRICPDSALGICKVDSRNTYVRAVAGVEPEDFLTIAHRYVTVSESRRTAGNLIR